MNTAQIEVFGGVVEQLESMGFINLRTENENGVIRFYGCQGASHIEDLLATIDQNGQTIFG
jgi:hypothetical protein